MILALTLLSSCKDDPADTGSGPATRGDCNPVEASHCLLPFPSEFFEEADADRPSGRAVAFGPTSLPANVDGVPTEPDLWNDKDGFSTLTTMYAHFPDATLDGVIGHTDLGAYADGDALTVVLNAVTGERLPHWVEREASAPDPERSLLMLRPAAPMEHATRYVVGIRGLVDSAGGPVQAPAGFAALRDGADSGDPDLERQRAHYDQVIFPALEATGFERDELQLAWSFTTVSAENSLARAIWMRDDALSRVEGGPEYVVEEQTDGDCEAGDRIGRILEGHLTVPLYLTEWDPGSLLTRDEDGMPFYNGDASVPFTVIVPCTLLSDPRPGHLLQYGHGLLGSRAEIHDDHLAELAQDNGWIVFATDWTGMKRADSGAISLMLTNDLSHFAMVPERTLQGYVEALVAARMMLGPMAADPALTVDGTSLVDTSSLWFYGASQGAVLGGGYAALSTDVDRVALSVPGTPFTLLLTRAEGFSSLLQLMEVMYPDWADISLLMGSFQTLWDPGESAGYAHFLTSEPLDGITPNKDVLLQPAVGDASVTTLGAHVMARAYGAAMVDPPVREIWGLETRDAPFVGSAINEFDWGDTAPVESLPADPSGAHEGPRNSAQAQEQIRAFFEDGQVVAVCDGPCDPD